MMLGAYFSVTPAGRFSESVRVVRNNAFELLVLCHSIPDDEQEYLANIARSVYAPVEVLALSGHSDSEKPFADYVYDIHRGPWDLVKTCAQIVGYGIKSEARHLAAAS